MGKDKLKRFAENAEFRNLIQPKLEYPPVDHLLKGKWNTDFFKNDHLLILELCCGRGEYTIQLAEKFPYKNFIGIDWKGARLWRGAKTGIENKMDNVAFLRIQIQTIRTFFSANEVDEIWITFPDPNMSSPRERKRMTSPRFLENYESFLKPNGIIHLKTDNFPFYEYSLEMFLKRNYKIQKHTDDLYGGEMADEILSIKTTYEKMWLKEGARICYLKAELPQRF